MSSETSRRSSFKLVRRPPATLTTRPAAPSTVAAFQQRQRARLDAGELDATKIAKEQDARELASWTLVARALMNLDEVITKQ